MSDIHMEAGNLPTGKLSDAQQLLQKALRKLDTASSKMSISYLVPTLSRLSVYTTSQRNSVVTEHAHVTAVKGVLDSLLPIAQSAPGKYFDADHKQYGKLTGRTYTTGKKHSGFALVPVYIPGMPHATIATIVLYFLTRPKNQPVTETTVPADIAPKTITTPVEISPIKTEEEMEYDDYRGKVEAINENRPSFQRQLYECDKDGKRIQKYDKNEKLIDGGGRCNVSSAVMLLNRKRARDGNVGREFTPEDVFGGKNKNGKTKATNVIKHSDNMYEYSGGTVIHNGDYYSNGDKTYTMNQKSYSKSSRPSESDIVSLLQQHPEGIMVYAKGHWIVLTDYTIDKDTGSVQLWAMDGVNYGMTHKDGQYPTERCKLEDTYEFRSSQKLNGESIYNYISEIVYDP